MGSNLTPYRSLDKVAKDPRVLKVYEDSDGIWVDLAPGFNFEGMSSLRRDTAAGVLLDWRGVENGEPH
jgi:hypothetical protein